MVTSASPRRSAALLATGAAALVLLGALTDAGGRVLAWPVAVLLVALATRDLVLGPPLVADAGGLQVVQGLHRSHVPWTQVQRVRVVRDRRTPLLEIDLGDRLVVLSRARLGAAPADVLPELLAMQQRAPRPGPQTR